MSYKVTDDDFEIVCACGEEQIISLDNPDIILLDFTIVLPPCPNCHARNSLFVTVLQPEDENKIPADVFMRHKVNQNIFKRLIDRNIADKTKMSKEPPVEVFLLVEKSGTVEAPVNSIIAKIQKAKKDKKDKE